jgi:hypothetical protein
MSAVDRDLKKLRGRLERRLSDRRDPERAVAAAGLVTQEFERLAQASSPPPLACSKGCDPCCHGYVSVLGGEVFRILRYLARQPPERRQAFLDRVAAADARTRGRSPEERARDRVPCPLLENGACGVYEARPLACRAFVSLDAAACRRHFAGLGGTMPFPSAFPWLRAALLSVFEGAAKAARADGQAYELTAALRIAADIPEAEARWLDRPELLAPARSAVRRSATTSRAPTVTV